ncbi:MAG: DUF2911 domain-containing protein [Chitinophagaceae bacterium]|nr:DUF2911 domain-containing protein [Chitinophagaceae bacterium]
MKKHYLYSILSIIFLTICIFTNAQKTEEVCYNPNLVKDTTKKSIKSMAFTIISGDSIKINYHSPGVRKRIIWGGLVPYDEVWVTGAHDATTLEVPKPFVVNGKEIPAGKYAFFTIPGKKEWTISINKNWEQHLASEYDEKDDIVRMKVKPKKNEHTERLQYFIESTTDKNGKIAVAWEKLRIEFPFTIKK